MSAVQRSKRALVSLLKKIANKHSLDLDLSRRPPLSKEAYLARVKSVLRSKKAQAVAKAKFNAFRNVCREVVKKKGAASRT